MRERFSDVLTLVAVTLLFLSAAISANASDIREVEVLEVSGMNCRVAISTIGDIRVGDRFDWIKYRNDDQSSRRYDNLGLGRIKNIVSDTVWIEWSRRNTPMMPTVGQTVHLSWLSPGTGRRWGDKRFYVAGQLAQAKYSSNPELIGFTSSSQGVNGNIYEVGVEVREFEISSTAGISFGISLSGRTEIVASGSLSKLTSRASSVVYDSLGRLSSQGFSTKSTDKHLFGALNVRYRFYTHKTVSFLAKCGAWYGGRDPWFKHGIGSTLGLGARLQITGSFNILFEVDRRDNWRIGLKSDRFFSSNSDSHYRFAVYPELTLVSW